MIASTTATLTAARFGLAPSVKKVVYLALALHAASGTEESGRCSILQVSTAGLKLVDREQPLVSIHASL